MIDNRLLIILNGGGKIGWDKNISRSYKWGILRIVEMESGRGDVASQNNESEVARYHNIGMRMTKEGYWARCTKRLNLR